MSFKAYAFAWIDGSLICKSLKPAIAVYPPGNKEMVPVALFEVRAGYRLFPVWAIGEMAIDAYCYSKAALDAHERTIEVNVTAHLFGANQTACPVIYEILWHTRGDVRENAQRLASDMKNSGSKPRLQKWPFREAMDLPFKVEDAIKN
jgi:hypothetical protein